MEKLKNDLYAVVERHGLTGAEAEAATTELLLVINNRFDEAASSIREGREEFGRVLTRLVAMNRLAVVAMLTLAAFIVVWTVVFDR